MSLEVIELENTDSPTDQPLSIEAEVEKSSPDLPPYVEIYNWFEEYQNKCDADVLVYSGPVERQGYDLITKTLSSLKKHRKNAILYLSTAGGDPHAAFRIARALHHHYANGSVRVLIKDWCKSAGTLICIGANELILCDSAELGPLDVQVRKPDEMVGRMSGLDILRGMESLKDGLLDSFRHFLVDINTGTGISTKSAADVATKLAIGIYEPILEQVDPMRLGEMEAALTIAHEYGKRLNSKFENLQPSGLQRLVHGYPSHGFVIDRKEAREIFHRVASPTPDDEKLCSVIEQLIANDLSVLEVMSLNAFIEHLKTVFSLAEKSSLDANTDRHTQKNDTINNNQDSVNEPSNEDSSEDEEHNKASECLDQDPDDGVSVCASSS